MSDSATQIVSSALQLKEGAYTRVECDLTDKPRLYAVDRQNGPGLENMVKTWCSGEHMVFCVKYRHENYLLKVDGNKLMLETTLDTPDIASLTDSYWFLKKKAAASQQYLIQSKPFPTLGLIIKEEENRHWLFDIGDIQTTASSIAVFITQEKISW